jgi:hypothetical protein
MCYQQRPNATQSATQSKSTPLVSDRWRPITSISCVWITFGRSQNLPRCVPRNAVRTKPVSLARRTRFGPNRVAHKASNLVCQPRSHRSRTCGAGRAPGSDDLVQTGVPPSRGRPPAQPRGSVVLPTRPPPHARGRGGQVNHRGGPGLCSIRSGPGRERRANAKLLDHVGTRGCPAEKCTRARSHCGTRCRPCITARARPEPRLLRRTPWWSSPRTSGLIPAASVESGSR